MTESDIEILRVNAELIRKNLQWSCIATNIGTKKMVNLKKILMKLQIERSINDKGYRENIEK